ncbi:MULTISPECIES: glycosyltransferase family 2 protein [Microbacterium]|uniref:glycosyltransferase family 2 protein n=1 Tax=Microbacterium TaxID=33882 RepID=UPI000D658CB4|nr:MULTISPECIES: glycosyltransferase family 2 protein [Microbacterium]
MSTHASLDVVIVTYASRDLIRECLGSLFASPPRIPMNVVVVDNDSPDDTVEVVTSEFPSVNVVARPTNDGFAVANNVALRQSGAEYVLVLNPDTRIEPGTLDHLIGEMAADKTIGVLGCRLLTADGTLDHASKRSFPSPVTAAKYFLMKAAGRTGSDYVRPDIPDDGRADVDAVNGAFMLLRGDAMRGVGLLDEKYWMYGEDLDWCARFLAAGWRVVYDGRVVAHHLKGGSTSGRRPLKLNYHFHRSMLLFYRDHVSRGVVLVDVAVAAGVWARFGASALASAVQRLVRTSARPAT